MVKTRLIEDSPMFKMRSPILPVILLSFLLAGCDDGVPKLSDPHNPVDEKGKSIKGTEFLERYCLGKQTNETCIKVQRAVSTDSLKRGVPKGW